MPAFFSLLRNVLWIFLSLGVLAGCASVPPGEVLTKLPPGKGSVIARANGNRLAMATVAWIGITVKSTQTGETFFIPDRAERFSPQHVFIQQLPPGTYSLERIEGVSAGLLFDFMLNNNARMTLKDALGTFEVVAGKVTNLGTLYGYMPLKSSERKLQVTRTVTDIETRATLRRYAPEVIPTLQPADMLGWTTPVAENIEVVARGKQSPSASGARYIAADKSYWVGAQSGQVLRRSAEGQWSRMDTGLLMPVSSVRPLGNGMVLAGLEDGVVMLYDKGAWREVSVPYAGAVVALGQFADGTLVAIAATGNKQAEVFTSPCCDRIEWKSVKTISLDGMGMLGAIVTPDAISLMKLAPGIPPRRYATHYDRASNLWSEVSGESARGAVSVGVDQKTMCAFNVLSLDAGKSWRDYDPPYGTLSACRDAQTLYALKHESTGWASVSYSLYATSDGGTTWKKVNDLVPKFTSALDVLGTKDELIIRADDGVIHVSKDNGATWVAEKDMNDAPVTFITKD